MTLPNTASPHFCPGERRHHHQKVMEKTGGSYNIDRFPLATPVQCK